MNALSLRYQRSFNLRHLRASVICEQTSYPFETALQHQIHTIPADKQTWGNAMDSLNQEKIEQEKKV